MFSKLIMQEGGVGIVGLRTFPHFGSVFRFSHLKTAVFRFWGLSRFAGFLEFSLWFSVSVNNEGGFSVFFYPVHFTVFLVLPRKVALNTAQFQGPFI